MNASTEHRRSRLAAWLLPIVSSAALLAAADTRADGDGRWLTGPPGRPLVEVEAPAGSAMRGSRQAAAPGIEREVGTAAETPSAAMVQDESPSVWQPVARHAYSKVQAWNCDGSLLWLTNRGASPELVFLDAASGRVRFQRHAPGTEIRWLPDDPAHMVFVNDDTVGIWDSVRDRTTIVRRFPGLGGLAIGPWEGNLSNSGRELVVTGTRRRDGATVSLLFDLVERRVIARHHHPRDETIDWISVSASGRYIVLNGALAADGADQTRVFDRRFRPIGTPWLEYGLPSHYDLTLDDDGDDVAVGVAKSGEHEGRVIARRLRDGAIRRLTTRGYASHTSARNTRLPGWVFVTYPNAPPAWPGRAHEIVAVSLAGEPPRRVARLQVREESGRRYAAQAQALPSPDGGEVIWAATRPDALRGDDATPVSVDRGDAIIGTRIAETGFSTAAGDEDRDVDWFAIRASCPDG